MTQSAKVTLQQINCFYLMQNNQILLLLLQRETQHFANSVTKKSILQYLIFNEFTKGVYQIDICIKRRFITCI